MLVSISQYDFDLEGLRDKGKGKGREKQIGRVRVGRAVQGEKITVGLGGGGDYLKRLSASLPLL